MLVGAKVCDLTEDLLWFVCGLYVGILTSPLKSKRNPENHIPEIMVPSKSLQQKSIIRPEGAGC